jgi:hypothetical protein
MVFPPIPFHLVIKLFLFLYTQKEGEKGKKDMHAFFSQWVSE